MAGQVAVGGFTASGNGLGFVNRFPNEPVVGVDAPPFGKIDIGDASNGLCGGMVFAVRDIFQTDGMAPLNGSATPDPSSTLFNYIVGRLIDSFDLPHAGFMKYYEWMITPDGDTGWPPFFTRHGLAWKTIDDEWPNRIKPELDAGRLVCLGLVTSRSANPADLGQNHQVLGYGYELDADRLTLLVYDPNTSKASADSVSISFSLANPSQPTTFSHNVGIGEAIRGIFRVGYTYHDPTRLAPAASG